MTEAIIVGAGPYGLSIACHLRAARVPFRIFGRPMDGWRDYMPKGMLLKSDGFASNLADPSQCFTLARFCAERGMGYSDDQSPVSLDIFTDYGLWFQKTLVPEVENKIVVSIDRSSDNFNLRMDDGELITAPRVIVATGLQYFAHVPDVLAHLPREYVSHSGDHHDLEPFRGRRVVVIGGGASAIDLAGLLYDIGAEVQLMARQPALSFHGAPTANRPSRYHRFRHPKSGIGPGWRSRFYTDAPLLFHLLPEKLRRLIVRTHLRPAGGWFARDKLLGRVPLLLGHVPHQAKVRGGTVHLISRTSDGREHKVGVDHVIAATGYLVDIRKIPFLSDAIKSKIKMVDGTPILSTYFESSVSGLYFSGIIAANSFGPMLRFVYGAGFCSRRVAASAAHACALEGTLYNGKSLVMK